MTRDKEKLSKIYILKDIDWANVPNCVFDELTKLCADCVKQYQFGLPTTKSIRYAAKLYKRCSSPRLTLKEKEALHKMFRVSWTDKLFMAALTEFKQYLEKTFKKEFGTDFKFFLTPYIETKDIIFLDFNIRHPNIMYFYNKLSKLRCKARKICDLPKTAYVGF